jgi:hypothetical protein
MDRMEGVGGHKEASGHGFPAAGREERADARADFIAGKIGVPTTPSVQNHPKQTGLFPRCKKGRGLRKERKREISEMYR